MGSVQLTINSNLEEVIAKINQLDKNVENLNRDIAESGKVSKQAYDTATREADQFNQAQTKNQQTMNKSMQLFTKFAGVIGATFSVGIVLAWGKAVVSSTDAGADAMDRFKEGARTAFTFLEQALATLDFTNLIQGFKNAYQAGKDFADQMDELEDRRRAAASQTKEIDLEQIRLRKLARTRGLDVKDKQFYIDEIIRLEEEKLKITQGIANDDLQARLDQAVVNKQLSQSELRDLIINFDIYRDRLKEGEELSKRMAVLRREAATPLAGGVSPEGVILMKENTAAINAYNNAMSELTETQRENIRLSDNFNLITQTQRDAIANSSNAVVDADITMASADEHLQRIRNGLTAELLQDEKQKQEAMQKTAELSVKILEDFNKVMAENPMQQSAEEFDANLKSIEKNLREFELAVANTNVSTSEDYDQMEDNLLDFEQTMRDEWEDIIKWQKDNPFWAALGFENQDQLDQAEEMASQIFDVIQGIVDQQVEASERLVDDLNQRIDEQEQLVNREFELKKEGLGNNYALEQENLVKMQQARDQAIKDREKNIRIQRTLSTIEASISLITAAANIMKGFSSIPVVGVILGIAAVGAMIAAFIASQASINDATQFAKGGKLKGLRHSEGGIPIPGTGIEVEGDEYVTNRRSTQKYLPLLEAINKDDRGAMKLFFDRKFINKLPGTVGTAFDIDKSTKLGEIVRELRRGKADIIYGDGFIIERIGGYTKRINLN